MKQVKVMIHADKIVLFNLNNIAQVDEHQLVGHFDHFVSVDVRREMRQVPHMLLWIGNANCAI